MALSGSTEGQDKEGAWHGLADSTLVTGDALHSVTFGGRQLVLYRDKMGHAHVASALCPHNGVDLNCNKSAIVEGTIACPLHGWQFDSETGLCTLIPYNPAKTPRDLRLTEYPAREEGGRVMVWWEEIEAPG